MDEWAEAMALPPSAAELSLRPVHSDSNTLVSTPSSSTSGCISVDDNYDNKCFPSSLSTADFQLLLNKDASVEELLRAIDRCKELVLDTEECSEERKWIVRHLIELRLRLQDRKEADSDPGHPLNASSSHLIRVVLGHHFRPQPAKSTSNSSKLYCDHCARVIWNMLQSWYICEDCGFYSHHKCVGEIIRVCVNVRVAEESQYQLAICPEEGLHLQNYRCAECRSAMTLDLPERVSCFGRKKAADANWNEARLCDYDGKYYCPRCHWNAAWPIPARIVHNWDLEPRQVCQASAQLLRLVFKRPLLPLAALNSRLFGLVHELSVVRKQRNQLILMKHYLIHCRIACKERILSVLGDRLYMVDGNPDADDVTELKNDRLKKVQLYSMQDLIDTENGVLSKYLQNIMDIFSKHIKRNCVLCTGRGHICELCDTHDILYPFDDAVVTCKVCRGVYHRACWTIKGRKCTKCERRFRKNDTYVPEIVCDGNCSGTCHCSTNIFPKPQPPVEDDPRFKRTGSELEF